MQFFFNNFFVLQKKCTKVDEVARSFSNPDRRTEGQKDRKGQVSSRVPRLKICDDKQKFSFSSLFISPASKCIKCFLTLNKQRNVVNEKDIFRKK